MERLTIGDWTIEVDVERTKAFYQAATLITHGCTCLYCNNFVASVDRLPDQVVDFLGSLGIDPAKEGEVSEYHENADGTHLYGGFYHIVGRILHGPDCWAPAGDNIRNLNEGHMIELQGFSFGFTYDLSLLPDHFPAPVLQLEFLGNVPWVLEEKP